MSQTTIRDTLGNPFSGVLGDGSAQDLRSFVSAEASAEIPFGVMACLGSTYDKAILPVDANSVPVGPVAHDHSYQKTNDLGDTGLKPKTMLNVLNRGRMWVAVEDAVAVGATVFWRYTASGGNTQLGKFRSDGDTSKAKEVAGSRVLVGTSGAGIALVEFDMMAQQAAANF